MPSSPIDSIRFSFPSVQYSVLETKSREKHIYRKYFVYNVTKSYSVINFACDNKLIINLFTGQAQ